MKRPLHTITTFFVFLILVNVPQINAANIWQTNPDNGGGEWSESSTWISLLDNMPGVPEPGDLIIINGNAIVTISSTVDLRSTHNNMPTSIVINGTLKFWSSPGCQKIECNVDLLLDSGSEINVKSEAPLKGIQEGGPNAILKDIFIGGISVLPTNEWPFGPGILPMEFALPVQLVSFAGMALENSNMIKWQTAIEENTKAFVLERSATGREDFAEITTIDANGFSESLQTYSYEDERPLSMSYYRLKMVDFDGSFSYSDIIVVEKLPITVTAFEIFPVPIQNAVTVRVSSEKNCDATLTLNNYLGQVILVEHLKLNAGVNEFKYNWDNLNSSMHFVTIENAQGKMVKKVF